MTQPTASASPRPAPAAASATDPAAAAPRSPRAARLRGGRRDLRLAAGVALVVVSVVVGGRVLAAADDRIEVWSLRAPLGAGTTLTSDDIVAAAVALDEVGAYLPATTSPAGLVLLRDVGEGELLPAAAVADADASSRRLVTVAVDPLHAPPALARGERVDVWVSPPDGASAAVAGAGPVLVLAGVLVADPGAPDTTGLTDQLGVVLDVAERDAERAVAAARAGDVDLVRVGG